MGKEGIMEMVTERLALSLWHMVDTVFRFVGGVTSNQLDREKVLIETVVLPAPKNVSF